MENKSAAKKAFAAEGRKPPTLDLFILKQGNSGVKIDLEALLSELIAIWAESGRQINPEDARSLIDDYFPAAMKIKSQDEMHLIFEEANLRIGASGFLPT